MAKRLRRHLSHLVMPACAWLLIVALLFVWAGPVVYAAFVGPATITVDGTFTDWGTAGSPATGAYVYQDGSNSGTGDGNGFNNTFSDLNYVWNAISTQSGGSTPASPSNLIQYYYYRIDTNGGSGGFGSGTPYNMQLNLGVAGAGYVDHLLQIYAAGSGVTLILFQYNTPYPAIRAFTTGSLVGKVSNVANPYSGFATGGGV